MSTLLQARLRTVPTLDPDAPAIEYCGEWTSWGALDTIADGVEACLHEAELGADARVAVVLHNRPAIVGVLIGVLRAGATVVTVNGSYGDTGLTDDLVAVEPDAVIALETDWRRTGFVDAVTGALGIEVTRTSAEVKVRRAGEAAPSGPARPGPGSIAVEMLTSGTTGPPKRIPLSYGAFEETLTAAGEHYSSSGDDAVRLRSGVALVSSPLVHMSGLFRTLLNICQGRRIVLLDRFRVQDFVDAVQRHRPRAVSLVPSALAMVLDADVDAEVFSGVQVVTSGTAHLPVQVQEAFEQRYGVAVLPSYGATEFAGGVAGWNLALHREWGKAKRGSVGRAQRGRQIRIVSLDDDTDVPPGVQGRIEVRTGTGDWVRTTDLGRLDADGFLYVDGRTDDVIVRGGFKVTPAVVVEALRSHPAVRDAGVTGVPDQRLGSVPVAAVELVKGSIADSDDLLDYLRERLPRYQVPAKLIVVDELPRTASLKVSQPALRELFNEEVAT